MGYVQHKSEESLEDYLETIFILSRRLSAVRSIDVANELDFSKPSVSVAMKNLKNKNYITVSEDGYIRLTESGRDFLFVPASYTSPVSRLNSARISPISPLMYTAWASLSIPPLHRLYRAVFMAVSSLSLHSGTKAYFSQ